MSPYQKRERRIYGALSTDLKGSRQITRIANEELEGPGPYAFAVGQRVRITRRETWQGRICTVLVRQPPCEGEPENGYFLDKHGWRAESELEAVV